MMNCYRNTGGFDMLGSGRDKIDKPEEFQGAMAVCTALSLDGLVVIGGDDSNTNAAVLAEFFEANGCKCRVIGAPKTIDGDLKTEHIPVSFGFDTVRACVRPVALVYLNIWGGRGGLRALTGVIVGLHEPSLLARCHAPQHRQACKTYSELIGNVMLDCLSSKKYYHLIRLMVRSFEHHNLLQ